MCITVFKAFSTALINLTRVRFPSNSSLGMVISFKGANLDFAVTRLVLTSFDSYTVRRYICSPPICNPCPDL